MKFIARDERPYNLQVKKYEVHKACTLVGEASRTSKSNVNINPDTGKKLTHLHIKFLKHTSVNPVKRQLIVYIRSEVKPNGLVISPVWLRNGIHARKR